MKLLKLNQIGSTHLMFPLLAVFIIAAVGVRVITASHAATPNNIEVAHIINAPKGLPPALTTANQPVAHSNLSTTTTTNTAPTGVCQLGACYYYVGASQSNFSGTGASVSIAQADPKVGTSDMHSLAELAVQSPDGQQIVEVGWVVANQINGDNLAHLFVYHWVNRVSSCYNGCGFVALKGTYYAGEPIQAGTTGKFKIQYSNNQWQIYYNNTELGYYPESLWGGYFIKTGLIQVFGEVAASMTQLPKTQMGNGVLGSKVKSAFFHSFSLIGTSQKPALSEYSVGVTATAYSNGSNKTNGFRFGGPGY